MRSVFRDAVFSEHALLLPLVVFGQHVSHLPLYAVCLQGALLANAQRLFQDAVRFVNTPCC